MQIWDGGVLGTSSSPGRAQLDYSSSEGGDFVGGQARHKTKIMQALARKEDAGAGAGTRPRSQETFIAILAHLILQADPDRKEGVGVIST